MKTENIFQKTKSVITFTAVVLTTTSVLSAADYQWAAESGLLPDQVEMPMAATVTAAEHSPVLTNGALTLATDTVLELMLYQHAGTNLDMPTQLVIQAEMKFVSGNSTDTGRTPAMIGFVTAPYVGGLLCIGQDSVFLSRDSNEPGPTAAVDTDDSFHSYRIEVDTPTTPGTPIRVYRDGSLLLTDTLLGSGSNAEPEPQIWFGDGTARAYGESRWKSFAHNAARLVIRPPVTSIRVSQAEICWNSYSNLLYTIQYRSELTTNQWTDLFPTNILATGSETCVFDDIPRGRPQRYYQVIAVP